MVGGERGVSWKTKQGVLESGNVVVSCSSCVRCVRCTVDEIRILTVQMREMSLTCGLLGDS